MAVRAHSRSAKVITSRCSIETGSVIKLAKTTVSRGLHGTATLLPDASVLFAGENREALVRPDDPSFPMMISYAVFCLKKKKDNVLRGIGHRTFVAPIPPPSPFIRRLRERRDS